MTVSPTARLWPPRRAGPLMQAFATTFGVGIFCSPAAIAADLAVPGTLQISRRYYIHPQVNVLTEHV